MNDQWVIASQSLAQGHDLLRAGHPKEAIECFYQTLSVTSRTLQTQDLWASAHRALGDAHSMLPDADATGNLDARIRHYRHATEMYTRNTEPRLWAQLQSNLGNAYAVRSEGGRSPNQEKAIDHYLDAIDILTPDAYPLDHVQTAINLSSVLLDRIEGDAAQNQDIAIEILEAARAELSPVRPDHLSLWIRLHRLLGAVHLKHPLDRKQHIAEAVSCFTEALSRFSATASPLLWARLTGSLARALYERSAVDDAGGNDLERAIAHADDALNVCDPTGRPVLNPDDTPGPWSSLVDDLGTFYCARTTGDPVENADRAVQHHKDALTVRSREATPTDWVTTKINLASTLASHPGGDKAQHQEEAIHHYEDALEVCTEDDDRHKWGSIQYNLGRLYSDRWYGNPARNLETARTHLQNALTVRTREELPEKWAMAKSLLASICVKQAKLLPGKHALDVEASDARDRNFVAEALDHYKQALAVYIKEAFPERWARIQVNRAELYLQHPTAANGDPAHQALQCCKRALEVYTPATHPLPWGLAQNNLGQAYQALSDGNHDENWWRAAEAYRQAMSVLTPDRFPFYGLLPVINLAVLQINQENWQDGLDTFREATAWAEQYRRRTSGTDTRDGTQLRLFRLYVKAVLACVRLGRTAEALTFAEQSKGRALADLLAQRDLAPDVPDALKQRYRDVHSQLASLKQSLTAQRSLPDRVIDRRGREEHWKTTEQLEKKHFETRRRFDAVLDEVAAHDETFRLVHDTDPLSFDAIQNLLPDDRTAAVSFLNAGYPLFVFIFTRTSLEPVVVELTREEHDAVAEWIDSYQDLYQLTFKEQVRDELHLSKEMTDTDWKNAWSDYLGSTLADLADRLHLGEILSAIPSSCDRLLIIPHLAFHHVPFAALPVRPSSAANATESDASSLPPLLVDRFPAGIRYAPSLRLLEHTQSRERPSLQRLLTFHPETPDLRFTESEADALDALFPDSIRLDDTRATKAALFEPGRLDRTHVVHFACHGISHPDRPVDSALEYENDGSVERLTLGEIFQLSLPACRLVTLSACETGLVPLHGYGDEYVGLPSGFLFAGSPAVISSLWPVHDVSTAILMMDVYQRLLDQPSGTRSVSRALGDAQRWLRQANRHDIANRIRNSALEARSGARLVEAVNEAAIGRTPPFSSPYHWAGFFTVGD